MKIKVTPQTEMSLGIKDGQKFWIGQEKIYIEALDKEFNDPLTSVRENLYKLISTYQYGFKCQQKMRPMPDCQYKFSLSTNFQYNKEVFVKHGKAPTAPQFERGIDYLGYVHVLENNNVWTFLPILTNFRWLNLAETHKRHIYTPRPFIWAYNQVSMTFHSKVVARTSTRFEKPLFRQFWPISPPEVGQIWPTV